MDKCNYINYYIPVVVNQIFTDTYIYTTRESDSMHRRYKRNLVYSKKIKLTNKMFKTVKKVPKLGLF